MGILVEDDKASDICYRNLMGAADWALDARAYFENLYSLTSDILDRKFLQQAKANLNACYAEMYFASVCREKLNMDILHPSDEGLDFYLRNLDCWVECIAASAGDSSSDNSIPSFPEGKAYQFPERQFFLRLANSFQAKSKKILNDINKSHGLVNEQQPIVVFVSAGALHDRYSFYIHPPMFSVLLGLGKQIILLDQHTRKCISSEYEYRKSVEKNNGEVEVEIGYFFDSAHSHISAVIYSWSDFANPLDRSDWGRDFFILHNPLAKNKLPYGFMPCGKEFYVNKNLDSYEIVRFKIHDQDHL